MPMATSIDSASHDQLPSRFTIYDSDLSCNNSDSEIDVEEWVSISSSTTTTTISSLPQHLNLSLKPRPDSVKPPVNSSQGRFNLPRACSAHAIVKQHGPLVQPSAGLKPAIVVKQSLPKLTTVYIVDPKRLPNPQWSNQSPMELFHYGQYARICSRCAKPQMVVSCDGTWTMVAGGICDLHIGFMRPKRFVMI